MYIYRWRISTTIRLNTRCYTSPQRLLRSRHIFSINPSTHHPKRLSSMILHLLYQLIPIYPMHHLSIQHHLHISLQLPPIHLPKPSHIPLQLPPIHHRTIIPITIILSLQQPALQHQHTRSKYIRSIRIYYPLTDFLITYYPALLRR